jgi:hypothetical protein
VKSSARVRTATAKMSVHFLRLRATGYCEGTVCERDDFAVALDDGRVDVHLIDTKSNCDGWRVGVLNNAALSIPFK